ncbi:MAG TPA: BatA domain-containing protein [Thermodesulfobacteriota bacterium]|nr:BatA domain-containing protein [Thermodesulfobacteriota bacterium]
MNFSFLNPFFLIGLVTIAVPIIAHLISKKSGVKRSFPSVRFLIASQGETARRSKIKDLMLLLIRALTLVMLVLVFSKPAVFSFSPINVKDVKSVAVVVDNSFSMDYRDNFERAKSETEKLIGSLADGSFGFVVPLVPTDDTSPKVTQDRNEMIRDLNNIELSYSFTDNERRLEEIFSYLQKAPNERKEVILLTDLQKNGWKKGGTEREWLVLVDVAQNQKIKNHAISHVAVKEEKDTIKISVTVSNHSKTPLKRQLTIVSLGGKEIKEFFDMQAESQETKEFIFPKAQSARNAVIGRVEISHDDLNVDDVRHFVWSNSQEPRFLIVDGDPREDVRLSETYYITRAVETIFEKVPVNFFRMDNDAFLLEGLEKYDLILLANVGDLIPQKARQIEEYIERGGVIVIFLGDRVRSSVYNVLLRNVLPCELGNFIETDLTLEADELSGLTRGLDERLREVKVNKLYSLNPATNSNTILTASNLPFLAQRETGKGSVFLFASTADTSWSNFPITPVFVPIMKNIFDLSLSTGSKRTHFLVGETVGIEFSGKVDEVTVENPSGEEFKVYRENPKFDRTVVPGIYTVKTGTDRSYSFSVNVDPRESNLEKVRFKKGTSHSSPKGGLVKVFKEIWVYFLWGAIFLFVSESVVRMLYTK